MARENSSATNVRQWGNLLWINTTKCYTVQGFENRIKWTKYFLSTMVLLFKI